MRIVWGQILLFVGTMRLAMSLAATPIAVNAAEEVKGGVAAKAGAMAPMTTNVSQYLLNNAADDKANFLQPAAVPATAASRFTARTSIWRRSITCCVGPAFILHESHCGARLIYYKKRIGRPPGKTKPQTKPVQVPVS